MANKNLHKAKHDKNDEFYTQLSDIEDELRHYKDHFKGKVVYCNCDDPFVSNFFRYFSLNFEHLGLKKLIATCYRSDNAGVRTDLSSDCAIKLEYEGGKNGDGLPTLDEVTVTEINGDGDFRSDECVEILKEADIVVTNPPFSLFREYIAQLMKYEKSFVVVGSMNAITYKDFFVYLKDNKIWQGYKTGGFDFEVPMDFEQKNTHIKGGKRYAKFGNITWFTNLDIAKRHEDIILYKPYDSNDYLTYENFDAIEVSKVKDIPVDYDGVMGVPITFLTKHNPDQFNIIGLGISTSGLDVGVTGYKPEHKSYRKNVQKRGAVDGDLYIMIDGEVKVPYARILIQKQPKLN